MLCTCLWVLLCLLCAEPGCLSQSPCPQPPAAGLSAFTPEDAFTPKPQFQTEWNYVGGSLCVVTEDQSNSSCQQPLAVQLTTLQFNVTVGGKSALTSTSIIAVTYGQVHFTSTTVGHASSTNAEQPFDLTFTSASTASPDVVQYNLEQGVAGQLGTIYNFLASSANVTINLLLQDESGMMVQGDGGYVGIKSVSPGLCEAFYYVSVPQLSTHGTIRLNGSILLVRGMSWFDHEWGTNTAGFGWIWLGIRVGKTSVMVSIPRDSSGTLYYSQSILNVQYENGTMFGGSAISLQIVSNWTSPLTQILYPVHFYIFTSLLDISQIEMIPIFLNQEVHNILPGGIIRYLWEGDMKVKVINGSLKMLQQSGDGYLELVGFTATG